MSTSTPSPTSFKSSELSRSSAHVFAAAADHPVRVTRRDGEALVLMSESADKSRTALLELAAQLVAISTDTAGSFADHMGDRFPWMLALSPADRESCAKAVLAAARASFATNQPHLAIAELTSWRETATAVAAGLGTQPVEWLEDLTERVERP
jgi:PHD/YefM family antitoxin component YafN of YafNO toxin-antitoxin module